MDDLTVEEPLEIRIGGQALAVLMRTPGDDLALVAGFLLTEGLLRSPDELGTLGYCPAAVPPHDRNVVDVGLAASVVLDTDRLRRSFYATSSCGVCGKASIEQLRSQAPPLRPSGSVPVQVLWRLPAALRQRQRLFSRTGALHAAGLFDPAGGMLQLCEDVGRHNAVDKLVGRFVLAGTPPPPGTILVVSGRASFEIVQKAWMSGIGLIAALSGASTLAVDLAEEAGITLVAFLRSDRATLYTHARRLTL